MKICFLICLYIFFVMTRLHSGILINEIATGTSGDDWVELFFKSSIKEKTDISGLYVTMYYGNNEKLSEDPVSLYSYDRPETPYDDRFAVVHMTNTITPDETDLTGDTNHNGHIDIYCNNYSGSLWNSDGVVAIDTDDDPYNNGIIDFVSYSNRDGTPNETIISYVLYAQGLGHWGLHTGDNVQECMVDIGKNGLPSYMTISRNGTDSSSMDDFRLTKFMTPGRENIFNNIMNNSKGLFSAEQKRIAFIPGHPELGHCLINIFIYEICSVRLRIFNSTGIQIFESQLFQKVPPGRFSMRWNGRGAGRTACTGLYIAYIEAVSTEIKKTEKKKLFIILSHYK